MISTDKTNKLLIINTYHKKRKVISFLTIIFVRIVTSEIRAKGFKTWQTVYNYTLLEIVYSQKMEMVLQVLPHS